MSPALQLLTLALWVSSLFFGSAESRDALMRLLGDFGPLFWGGAVIAGLVIPLILGGWTVLRERRTGDFSYVVPAVTSVLVLIGGLCLRYVVIMAV